MEQNLPYDQVFQVIRDRFNAAAINLEIDADLEIHFEEILTNMKKGCSKDYLASRGEYLSAVLVAAYLKVDFVDAAGMILFDDKGRLLFEETDNAIASKLSGA